MSQELVSQQATQAAPFGNGRSLMPGGNVGAIAIEQERAIAEAQGQLVLAKRFPRDLQSAHAELMTACKNPAFAATAFYKVPNRGEGPSIRMAEEIARVVGNFQYGHRELGRTDGSNGVPGKSEVEVFAWDMEKNNRSTRQITVLHVRDTSSGPKRLTDQTDIDNRIANVASKQIRGRILALMPKWLVADAIAEARATLAGNNTEPLEVRVRRMTQAFTQYGVTAAHLEKYLGHTLDKVLLDELVDLQGVFNALREGTPASEFFGEKQEEAADAQPQAESLKASARRGAATAKPAKTKPTPAADDAPPAAAVNESSTASNEPSTPAQENSNQEQAREPVQMVDTDTEGATEEGESVNSEGEVLF